MAVPDQDRFRGPERRVADREREYQRGRRDAEVDGRLAEHDKHLRQINGSIVEQVRELALVNRALEALSAALSKRDAIADALADATLASHKALEASSAKAVTRLQLLIASAAIIVAIAALFVGSGGLR